MKRVLFIGKNGINSQARRNGLKKAGCEIDFLNAEAPWGFSIRFWMLLLRSPVAADVLDMVMRTWLKTRRLQAKTDIVFLNQCELFGSRCLAYLSGMGRVVNYINDDPFANAEEARWRNFFRQREFLDCLAVVRTENVQEAVEAGFSNVVKVYMGADPDVLDRYRLEACEEVLEHDIVFVGTYFPERGPFFLALQSAGLPFAVYGPGWRTCKEYQQLKEYIYGERLDPARYTHVICKAKIALCLLSEKNRDQYTTRSFEIPYLGTLIAAPATKEHLKIFGSGRSAVLFQDALDCADQCRVLLQNDQRRQEMANECAKVVGRGEYTTEDQMRVILEHL